MSIRQLTHRLSRSNLFRGPVTNVARFASCWKDIQLVSLDICTNADYAQSKLVGAANLKNRVAVVDAVLSNIKDKHNSFRGDEVLKVCMMPEFFFRDQTGAYQLETILGRRKSDQTLDSDNLSLQYRLADLVKGPEWKNWFFLFGTVLGEKPMTKEMIEEAMVKKYTGAANAIENSMATLNNNLKDATKISPMIEQNCNSIENDDKDSLIKRLTEIEGNEEIDKTLKLLLIFV